MKDKNGATIYVGKAKNLKKRIKSYFQKNAYLSQRLKKLLENTKNIEYIVTDSELEAYILESNLIKELHPKYNILMKDDTNFVYIKIALDEDFPRVRIVRKIEKDNAKYIGPKMSSNKVLETFKILKRIFPFRHCQLDIFWKNENKVEVKNRVIEYPCLDYFIKRCLGPCTGNVFPQNYRKMIIQLIDFLEGKNEDLIKKLETQMRDFASEKKFEQAANVRNKLFAVKEILAKQKISDPERTDADIINYAVEMGRIYFNLFMIRGGKLISQENFIFDVFDLKHKGDVSENEIIEAFLRSYYTVAAYIPREILIPAKIDEKDLCETWLSDLKKEKVKIIYSRHKLLELCKKNAVNYASQHKIKFLAAEAEKNALNELAKILEFPKTKKLRRIECYDISHIGGSDTVGSMVVFENGLSKKEHYRHFKLRIVKGISNDFENMKEILMRRLKYLGERKIKIRGARKKESPVIEKILKVEKLDASDFNYKDFRVIEKNKKIIGCARIKKYEKNVEEVASLWIDKKVRKKGYGGNLLKFLIEKSKSKRIYVLIFPHLIEFYAIHGFEEIRALPKILGEKMKLCKRLFGKPCPIPMVYDKLKHKKDVSFVSKPDLIIVDGGKPQLSAAMNALKNSNLDIPVIALAKKLEEIYAPNKKTPVLMEKNSEALKLLQRLRDEAHRFAVEFQRQLHTKSLRTC